MQVGRVASRSAHGAGRDRSRAGRTGACGDRHRRGAGAERRRAPRRCDGTPAATAAGLATDRDASGGMAGGRHASATGATAPRRSRPASGRSTSGVDAVGSGPAGAGLPGARRRALLRTRPCPRLGGAPPGGPSRRRGPRPGDRHRMLTTAVPAAAAHRPWRRGRRARAVRNRHGEALRVGRGSRPIARMIPPAAGLGPPSPARAPVQPRDDLSSVARHLVEDERPVVAAHDDVLDPGPEPALEVDPRLHAERHALARAARGCRRRCTAPRGPRGRSRGPSGG